MVLRKGMRYCCSYQTRRVISVKFNPWIITVKNIGTQLRLSFFLKYSYIEIYTFVNHLIVSDVTWTARFSNCVCLSNRQQRLPIHQNNQRRILWFDMSMISTLVFMHGWVWTPKSLLCFVCSLMYGHIYKLSLQNVWIFEIRKLFYLRSRLP